MQVTSSPVQMSQVSATTANEQSDNPDQCQCFGRTVSRPSSTAVFLAVGLTVGLTVGVPIIAVSGNVLAGCLGGFTGVIAGGMAKCLYTDYWHIGPTNPTPPPSPLFGTPGGEVPLPTYLYPQL